MAAMNGVMCRLGNEEPVVVLLYEEIEPVKKAA